MDAFAKAFGKIQTAERQLNACGFFLGQPEGWGYFYGKPSEKIGRNYSNGGYGDGHVAPISKLLKEAEDDSFQFVLSWFVGDKGKGWTIHYRSVYPPISLWTIAALNFLELQTFEECPYFDFKECFWRFIPYETRGDTSFDSNTEVVHRWFDAHKQNFTSGVKDLLSAQVLLQPFKMKFLPIKESNREQTFPPKITQAAREVIKKDVEVSSLVITQPRNITILFLGINPLDTGPLRLDEEIRAIDQALRQTKFRDRFIIMQQWAVRVTDLQSHLLRYKPDIVHFSGHGNRESEIILEDSSGKSHPVSTRALSQLFSVLKDNIRCVVLNACYSEQQAQAIAEHIDCVVGISKAIEDAAAISFAMAFYQAIGYGRDVNTAFNLGRVQIDLENLNEQETPKLLAINSNPEEIIFAKDD